MDFNQTHLPEKRSIILCLLIGLAIASFPGLCSYAGPPEDDYKFAVGLFRQKRWKQAAEEFRSYLETHPRDSRVANARLYFGLTLIALDRYAEARDVFRKFVGAHPEDQNLSIAMYRLAECSVLLDDLKPARADLTAYLDRFPDDSLAEYALPYLGEVQLRLNDPAEAAGNFRKALERFPESEMADDSRFGLARALQALGETEQAVDLYQELAKGEGRRAANALMRLAARDFDSGNYSRAAEKYVAVSERFPESRHAPSARLNAGYAYYQSDRYADAVTQFQRARQAPAQAATADYWQGLSYKALGDYAQAVETFKPAAENTSDSDLTAKLIFQWADCERRRGGYEEARRLFLKVVESWPESPLADDSLYFAGECRLQHAGQLMARGAAEQEIETELAAAEKMLDRFEQEYPQSGLRLYHELQQGRLMLARGGEASQKAAVERFRRVLEESRLPKTQAVARYQLARAYQKLGDYAAAAKTVAPLTAQSDSEPNAALAADALLLYGRSLLAEEKFEQAEQTLARFLETYPDAARADEALATKAISEAQRGDLTLAEKTYERLRDEHPESTSPAAETAFHLAEAAYANDDWQRASRLFEAVVQLGKDAPQYVRSLSGLAWSQYERGQFADAAANFGRVIDEAPEHELAPEAAYKRGESLEHAGQLSEAATAYSRALQSYASSKYAYLAGLQAARIRAELNDVEAADAAYAALLQKFPQPDDLDKVLDEWALLHYEAENFDQADKLFARIVAETPDSDLADNARFSLAESDLIAGNLKAAQAAFAELVSDSKADETVQQDSLYRLMGIAVEEQQWQQATDYVSELNTRFPNGRYQWDAVFYRGQAELQLQQPQQAVQTLNTLLDNKDDTQLTAKPWFPHVWVLLADAHLRLKQYDEVVETVEALRTWDPKSPVLYKADEILGRSYKNQAKFDEARTAFERVTNSKHGRRTETAAKSQLLIAETYFLQENYSESLTSYLKVYHLYQFPEWQARALYQAALCEELLGEWSDAVKSYQQLLDEFPDNALAEKARSRLDGARSKLQG